ncbi:oligosaccharide flippase family protein [Sphingomonas sp. 1P08PE]|uniref:oligosaccharide flippase family protein n=1 Tax=Sphingomonas sp. 1P08PE TaxID=554122 RepID=UPI0039A0C0A5
MALTLTRPSWQAVKRGMVSDSSLIIWLMIFQNLMRIVSSVTLTRLLNAEAFAVVAVITSISVTLGLVSDIGISAFLVRHERTVENDFRNEVWTLRLVRGITLSLVTFIIAIPAADFLDKPDLYLVIAVAGLWSVLDGLGSLAPMVALRNRKLRKLTAIDIGSQVFGILISIALAAWLRSYWAIIISNMVGQVMGIVFSYILYDNSGHRWRFSRERASELWRFSRFITGSTILTLIITQSDKLILTKALPLETLGLYVIAAGLAATPVSMVASYAARITYPLLAQVRREAPETLGYQYYHHRIVPTLFFAFAAGGLVGFAPAVIDILYDPRYASAGLFLRIMSISSFFSMGNYAANELMIVLGRTRFTLFTNVIRLTYLLAGGAIGWYLKGPLGIVWAVGTVEVVAQIFGWFALRRLGLLSIRWETIILATGAAGVATGYFADQLGRLVLGIH